MAWGLAAILLIAAIPLVSHDAAASTFRPASTIELSSHIVEIAVDIPRNVAYLSQAGQDSLSVVDISSFSMLGEVTVGSFPSRMDIDLASDRLFVALAGGPGLAVVDLVNRSLAATWDLGGPAFDVVVGARDRLFVTPGFGADTMNPKIVNATTGQLVGLLPTSVYPPAVADITPDGRYLFVAEQDISPSTVYKFDVGTDSATLVSSTDSLGTNCQDLEMRKDGVAFYLACGTETSLEVVDTATLGILSRLDSGYYSNSAAESPDGSAVLAGRSDPSNHSFSSYDAVTLTREHIFYTAEEVLDLHFGSDSATVLAYAANLWDGPYYLHLFSTLGPPSQDPIASFSFSPHNATIGLPVSFDASTTQTQGLIVLFAWDFGDGASVWGGPELVYHSHSYNYPGAFRVSLEVTDELGLVNSTTAIVNVTFPSLEYVMFEHDSGFRLPVPRNWAILRDQEFGTFVEMAAILYGASTIVCSVLVDVAWDDTVREAAPFLEALAVQSLSAVQQTQPDAHFLEAPAMTSVANHAAVVFVIGYDPEVMQSVTIVLSELHGRYWVITMTTTATAYDYCLSAYDRMVSGFEITLPAPPKLPRPDWQSEAATLLPWAGVAATAGCVAGLAVALLMWRWSRKVSIRTSARAK